RLTAPVAAIYCARFAATGLSASWTGHRLSPGLLRPAHGGCRAARSESHQPRETEAVRVRLRADRLAARTLLGAVLSSRHPFPRLRHRSSVHVPVGGALQAAVTDGRPERPDDQLLWVR